MIYLFVQSQTQPMMWWCCFSYFYFKAHSFPEFTQHPSALGSRVFSLSTKTQGLNDIYCGLTSLSGDNVFEVHYVQNGIQVLVTEASCTHVFHWIWVDDLVTQWSYWHVRPGGGQTHKHTMYSDHYLANSSCHWDHWKERALWEGVCVQRGTSSRTNVLRVRHPLSL